MSNEIVSSTSSSANKCTEHCTPQIKRIFLAIGIIVGLGATLAGFLGLHQIAFFGAIGTVGSQGLASGGLGLLTSLIIYKLPMNCLCQTRAKTENISSDLQQEDEESSVEVSPKKSFSYPPLIALIEKRKNALRDPHTPIQRVSLIDTLTDQTPKLDLRVCKAFDEEKSLFKFSTPKYESPQEYVTIAQEPMDYLKDVLSEEADQSHGLHYSQIFLAIPFIKAKYTELKEKLAVLKSRAKDQAIFDSRFALVDQTIQKAEQELEQLGQISAIWKKLTLLSDDFLNKDSLDILRKCNEELPDSQSPFYLSYPRIADCIKSALKEVSHQTIIGDYDPSLLFITWAGLNQKLGAQIPQPKTPGQIFKHQVDSFLSRFASDLQRLLTDNNEPSFTRENFQEILDYSQDEWNHFQAAMSINPFSLKYPIETFEKQFSPLLQLAQVWDQMLLMINTQEIDEKISLMQTVAERLPDTENPIWETCSLVRASIGDSLIPMTLGLFSNYQFMCDNPDHQAKMEVVKQSSMTIAKKLGCPNPKPPTVIMDSSGDPAITAKKAEKLYGKTAENIRKVYQDSLALGQGDDFAIMQVVEYINNLFSSYAVDEKQQHIESAFARLNDDSLCAAIYSKLIP